MKNTYIRFESNDSRAIRFFERILRNRWNVHFPDTEERDKAGNRCAVLYRVDYSLNWLVDSERCMNGIASAAASKGLRVNDSAEINWNVWSE